MHDDLLDEALRALDGGDDEALRVYADWLGEQGDPRGELIQLQLLPDAPDLAKRCKELIQAHGEAWLGEAGPMLTRVRWVRGFPYEARLAYALPRRPPELASLRILHTKRGGRHHREQTHALLVHDVLHDLRQVDGPVEPDTIAAWLDGEPRPLARLEAPLPLLQLDDALRDRLDHSEALPSLTTLERTEASHPNQWRLLLRTRLGRQLEALHVRCTVSTLSAWLGAWPDLDLHLQLSTSLRLTRTRSELVVDADLGRVYDGGTSVAMADLLARSFARLPAKRFATIDVRLPRAYRPSDAERDALAAQIERLRA